MLVTAAELPELLERGIRAKRVSFVKGPPAIGKSDIVKQLAAKHKLLVIDVRLSQSDPTDLNGFPSLNAEKSKGTFIPMDTFPLEGDPLPEGYNGWLLFLDEINSARLSVQAAAFKVTLDRMIGNKKLHECCACIAAGNREEDGGITERLSTPMQSRLLHYELGVEPKAWQQWAGANGIDYRIISFIGFKPGVLYDFKPDHKGDTYPSPRTWEFASDLLMGDKEMLPIHIPLLASAVEEQAAREFYAYAAIFESLITIPQILANPQGVKMPDEPSVQYALAGSIGYYMNENNCEKLMQFIDRMSIEFQILTLQIGLKRDKAILKIPSVKLWIKNNSKELFGM